MLTLAACASDGTSTPPQPGDTTALPPDVTVIPASSPDAGRQASLVPLTEMQIEEAFPGLSFPEIVYLTHPDDDTNRLFVVFPNERGVESAGTFLDIRNRVNDRGSEEGLLGLTFDPDFSDNGHFYVYYSASDPRRSVLSKFSTNASDPNLADPDSERVILQVGQPFANHNGGQVLFGPDGYLYVGLGDGGSGGDPSGNGQNRSTLLGAILRIDIHSVASGDAYSIPPDNPFVGADGVREEIFAYGLRNPWRFSFDRETGVLWAADVGQNEFEEIDIIKAGLNYGWNVMEGFHCFPGRDLDCDQVGLALPLVEYDHSQGCSVTGGYVYRGSRLPSLYGSYVYGDFCSGKTWALSYDGVRVTEHIELAGTRLDISSFGEGPTGELYILDFDPSGGKIYRFAPP